MRSLGLFPMADSIGVLPLRVTCVFLTVAALRINWAGAICDRVVWSRFGTSADALQIRSRVICQVSASSNYKMGMSSPHVGKGHKPGQQCPSELFSS